jgi:hypothetical protein
MKQDRKLFLNFSLAPSFILAFIFLRQIMHEAHELSHMTVGRLLCGQWGTRDFNFVAAVNPACEANQDFLLSVGLAGPLFNYIVIWIGVLMISFAKDAKYLSWGFVLIVSSLPIARIITAAYGGGDEMVFFKSIISNSIMARAIAILFVVGILLYPIMLAFKLLSGVKHRIWIFLTFLFAPMFLEGVLVHLFFNYLLKLGIMNTTWIMGTPLLVMVVLIVAVILFAFFIKGIGRLFSHREPELSHAKEFA